MTQKYSPSESEMDVTKTWCNEWRKLVEEATVLLVIMIQLSWRIKLLMRLEKLLIQHFKTAILIWEARTSSSESFIETKLLDAATLLIKQALIPSNAPSNQNTIQKQSLLSRKPGIKIPFKNSSPPMIPSSNSAPKLKSIELSRLLRRSKSQPSTKFSVRKLHSLVWWRIKTKKINKWIKLRSKPLITIKFQRKRW